MRKLFASTLTGGVLLAASVASPAAAAPNPNACHDRPGGAMHGTMHAHATVPESSHQAHMSIPHFCEHHG